MSNMVAATATAAADFHLAPGHLGPADLVHSNHLLRPPSSPSPEALLGEAPLNQHYVANFCANLTRWALEHECASSQHSHASSYFQQQQNSTTISYDLAAHNTSQNLLFSTKGDNGVSESPLTRLVTNHLQEPLKHFEGKVNYYFSDIWLASGDERTNRLPFIGAGPWKLIYATLIYLLIIKWLLPRLMQPFKPLELNWLIRSYNLCMVLSNMWAFYHGARILNFGAKCFGCETINHRDYSQQAIELLHYGWLFFLSRLIEWLDTIFFVLRKKERQVTKLHVFHHSFVPLISWTYLKYHPGYTVAFFPFVNSFVHSIMYTYYLLATFGPKVQPYLWWKRYLTSLQIAQFVLIIIQLASIPLTGDETCQYPRGFLYVAFAGAILFLWLFYTYYRDTYYTSRNKRATRQQRINETQSAKKKLNLTHNQQQQQQQRQGTTTHSNHINNHREGSSRSLSDAIDNAIESFRDDSSTSASRVKAD